jgi:hypothetical protein
MDDEAKKASRLEHKIKLLTQGYQVSWGWCVIFFVASLLIIGVLFFSQHAIQPSLATLNASL